MSTTKTTPIRRWLVGAVVVLLIVAAAGSYLGYVGCRERARKDDLRTRDSTIFMLWAMIADYARSTGRYPATVGDLIAWRDQIRGDATWFMRRKALGLLYLGSKRVPSQEVPATTLFLLEPTSERGGRLVAYFEDGEVEPPRVRWMSDGELLEYLEVNVGDHSHLYSTGELAIMKLLAAWLRR